MTSSSQQSNPGQNFLDKIIDSLFSFGSGNQGSIQRQAYDEIVKAQRAGQIPPGTNLDVLYNQRLDQLRNEEAGRMSQKERNETALENINNPPPAPAPVETKTPEPPLKPVPEPQKAPKAEDLPGRPPRYEQPPATNATNVIPALTDLMKMTVDQQREFLGGMTLADLIKLQESESRETNKQISENAKEREVIAQWGSTQRAMMQRDAAMALGLMNTAFLANTPNVSLMQQLNEPLRAIAPNYRVGAIPKGG
tara:strand:- start:961 stop:1716 length:756 start_codon:yes stop_codon:yes gene_type:complete